jgi:hypothetical protein
VGSTRRGTPLYQFTHQTFLEYFAAGHLARTHRTGRALWERLSRHIVKREWDVVAQIAIQILDRQVEGAIEDFLSGSLEDLEGLGASQSSEQHNLLSFAVRCLEFTVPNAQITRRIVRECVDFCLSTSATDFPSPKSWRMPTRSGVTEIIYQLMVVDPRNRSLMGRALLGSCQQIAEEASQDRALAALYIGLNLDKIASSFPSSRSARLMELPAALSRDFAQRVRESSWMLAFNNNGLALSLYQRGVASDHELALWLNHGAGAG